MMGARIARGALAAVAVGCLWGSAASAAALSPREVVAAKFAAVNRHAVADIAALYSPDAVITASDFCAPRGRADVERTYRGIFASLSDVRADVQAYVVEGESVAVRYVVRGAYNGQPVAVTILNLFTVRDGLIVRDDGVFDNAGRPCSK